MKLFTISRKGGDYSGQVCTLLIAAESEAQAEEMACSYSHPSKAGFNPDEIDVREIVLNEPQILWVQTI